MGAVPRAVAVEAPAADEERAAVVVAGEELAARRFPEMADSLVKAPGWGGGVRSVRAPGEAAVCVGTGPRWGGVRSVRTKHLAHPPRATTIDVDNYCP
jgi:hypothetical protein